ncbi:EAL domain-containing protein [Fredinandcohnia sp. QZ13]|uniref:EAL domain-containing protein n=1 Tax=Fredinandcohnia sp. QZ13 TaxID=3073144 RepID=UPI0028535C18|nr:EAL domain-containing protein [Fredinandcohnia sp. QZ13]MDR4889929.1 EAL domain-containing protein [Fredinandcohnia sp. QZ13]
MLLVNIDIKQMIRKKDFFHHGQTIYNINEMRKIGTEFLFRKNHENPELIFRRAKELNRLFELDTASIRKAFFSYFSSGLSLTEELLFVNVYPSTILNPQFPSFIESLLQAFPNSRFRSVFEIVESEVIENINLIKERVRFLQKLGYFIAIDDIGHGWASLCTLIELEPNYLKLERYFSINLPNSSQKQRMILLLLQYFYDSDTKIILEGVETIEELHVAQSLGVEFCQGYFLSRPQPVLV